MIDFENWLISRDTNLFETISREKMAEDFRLFKYNNVTFDKIVEFNGFYVIKFKAKIENRFWNI